MKDTFKPIDYLLEKDKKRIRELETLITHSISLKELHEYEEEIDHFMKKAYVRKQMREGKL